MKRHLPGEQQQQPANANGLRHAIDSGRTGDKVRVEDPSAAPLGTDDEAAGTTPTAEEVRLASAHELERRPPTPPHRAKVSLALTVAVIACVGLLAAAVAWSV